MKNDKQTIKELKLQLIIVLVLFLFLFIISLIFAAKIDNLKEQNAELMKEINNLDRVYDLRVYCSGGGIVGTANYSFNNYELHTKLLKIFDKSENCEVIE